MLCDYCNEPIPFDNRSHSRFCKATHRIAWHRKQRDTAFHVLLDLTRARQSGASEESMHAAAFALFGPAPRP